jgi:predicted nucleic acid-binding protein
VIVLDASVLVSLIVADQNAGRFRPYAQSEPEWAVPEHFSIEVLSALRGLWLSGHLDQPGFEEAGGRLGDTALTVWPTGPLITRIIELAGNVTAYDAGYLALAESLGVPLLTGDIRLTRVPGARCVFLPPPQAE